MNGEGKKLDWQDRTARGTEEVRASTLELVGKGDLWKLKLWVHRLAGKPDNVRQYGWFLSSHRLECKDQPLDAKTLDDAKAEAVKTAVIFLKELTVEMNSFLEQLQQGQGGWYKIEGTFSKEGRFLPNKGQEFPLLEDGDTLEITYTEDWQ